MTAPDRPEIGRSDPSDPARFIGTYTEGPADRWRSRPRNWALAAVGCAAVVGLAGWPLPTAYAICALTGLLALLAGVLKLRGELEHGAPLTGDDASGDSPLAGAGTSGSKGCTGCPGCGGPDCIHRADGAQTGADTDRKQGVDASARDHAADLAEQDARRQKEAEAAAAAGDAARKMSCGHTISSVRSCCDPTERTLRAQLAAAYFDLALAIGHDRQPYPTTAAYTAACAALQRHRERADTAEREQRMAAAAAEVWQANAELAAGRLEQARATITRVEAALDGLGPLAERHIRAALAAPVVQADAEQQVSDPQQVDESADDSCQVVHVDGEPVRIHGQGEMDETTAGHLAELVRAAKRRYAAEHPDGPPKQQRTVTVPMTWRPTDTFRRLAAGLTGVVRDEHGDPIHADITDGDD